MFNFKNIFSISRTDTHIIFQIFGLKITVRDCIKDYRETKASRFLQDTLDLTVLQSSKKVIVFFVPGKAKTGGGVMSVYSLCETSRNIVRDAYCCLSTFPNGNTYLINDKFYNNEKVLRFDLIRKKAKNVKELIIHIPEYYADDLYDNLTKKDIEFLKSIDHLQINIMNQNIEIMPKPEKIKDLYKLTDDITQTIAHDRYATQEVCDKWQIPTHLFSVNIDLSRYKTYTFDEKDKIIALSPDRNEYKKDIEKKLIKEFPDWQVMTIENLSFAQYMDVIGRSYFTITFGEGMDGYFNQPLYVGGLGIAVYNDSFFPDSTWKDLKNVYSSYEEMSEKLCDDLKELSSNKDLYWQTCQNQLDLLNKIYVESGYKSNIERFYKREYDFLPNKINKKEQ